MIRRDYQDMLIFFDMMLLLFILVYHIILILIFLLIFIRIILRIIIRIIIHIIFLHVFLLIVVNVGFHLSVHGLESLVVHEGLPALLLELEVVEVRVHLVAQLDLVLL